MRIRKKAMLRSLALVLTASQCMAPLAYAGTWESRSPTEWSYRNDDGSYVNGGWFLDPADGKWYYLDQNGCMLFGWQFIDGIWYFFNTNHDGTFGSALSNGWFWIDGYCYYFDNDCKMYSGTVTPDGFNVDSDGRWTENGTPVFVNGKGIITKSETAASSGPVYVSGGGGSSSGGGGGGSSGGGGGGGGSSSVRYYDYKIVGTDEEGNVLYSEDLSGKRNSFITINPKDIDGYEFVSGPSGSQKLTSDNSVFTLIYSKTEIVDDEKDDEEDVVETYDYVIRYVDSETGEEIYTKKGSADKGSVINIEMKAPSGYTPDAGNDYTFTLSEDDMEVIINCIKDEDEKELYSYSIAYIGDDGTELALISGNGEKGSKINIPEREFPGYKLADIVDDYFILDEDGYYVEILYEKTDDTASETDPDEQLISYNIKYIDRDTNDILMEENGTAEHGDKIIPDLKINGYQYASNYKFTVFSNESNEFIVYLIKEGTDKPEVSEVSYTVLCKDMDGGLLKTFTGTVTVGDDPVTITPDYEIEGYELNSKKTFEVTKDGENVFEIFYDKILGEYEYKVYLYDIDSMELIDTQIFYGDLGDTIDISDLCPDGYEMIGNPPENVTVSGNESNNSIKLYYKKVHEIPDTKKETNYVIKFRASSDNDIVILNDITGTWTVGEKLPVYYNRRVNTADGKIWETPDESPRIFTVRDVETNEFLIEYELVGEIPEEDTERTWTIRYTAEDTGSTLGIASGIGDVGDIVAFRNTFTDYGYIDSTNSFTISEDSKENNIEVILKRVNFPGHEPNEDTGMYDGREWSVSFLDSTGNLLLPSMDGFTVKGDYLTVDYPDIIEKDGVTYRAVKKSPYRELVNSTVYEQIIIQYITGESSESKLQYWKDAAQAKKDEFYGTTPYSYYVAYKELNSWNDIGLKFGVASAGTDVELETEDFPGWIRPTEDQGTLKLDEDGKTAIVQYEKSGGTTSINFLKRDYTIHFTDEEGNDLFDPYSGKIAFVKGNGEINFTVYYPNSFYDAQGNRWVADKKSPQEFTMSAMRVNDKTISYHKVFENEGLQFIVENNNDVNRILNDFATHTYDSKRHEFYLIGKGFNPVTAEVSSTMYMNNLSDYTNEKVDTFELNGETYTVVLVGYKHNWEQGSCTHTWEYEEDLVGNCYTATTQTVICSKCGKEVETIYPATGHYDGNEDSVCDYCGQALKRQLGDEITVTWDSKSLGLGEHTYDFICVDDNYNGTGDLLYIALSGIDPSIYGKYTEADNADWDSSLAKYFLDDEFADGLSVKDSLKPIDGSAVSTITKEEYDRYKAAALNKYPFPSGKYLTKTSDGNNITLTDGTVVSKEDASSYGIIPVFVMEKSDEDEGIRTGHWNVGDMQARYIGDKLYLFRCVSDNWTDKTNTDKSLALFLCDTVIPANEGMGYDDITGLQDTRFFGENNNYKYSIINEWLTDHAGDTGNLITTNIGIQNEYSGSTKDRGYENLDVRDLTRYTRSNPQVMYSKLFIPSVEEAIAMKDYLWKFNGSDKNNASEITTPYCRQYWLRTPEYGTSDMVYCVNLETGKIEPISVKAKDADNYSSTGIRPMYVVEQAY